MKRGRLVIARYNEDISWVNRASEFQTDVVIYDKSVNLEDPGYFNRISDRLVILPNIGREAHTYIRHIVENYDNLYDVEIFSQGRIEDQNIPDFWGGVSDMLTRDIDFLDFSTTRKIICLNESSYLNVSQRHPEVDINDRGSGSYIFLATDGHRKLYEMAHGQVPDRDHCHMEYGCHAIFAVTRERIQSIPHSVYKEMLDLFLVKGKSYSDTGSHVFWAYEFEYAWKLIFSPSF